MGGMNPFQMGSATRRLICGPEPSSSFEILKKHTLYFCVCNRKTHSASRLTSSTWICARRMARMPP